MARSRPQPKVLRTLAKRLKILCVTGSSSAAGRTCARTNPRSNFELSEISTVGEIVRPLVRLVSQPLIVATLTRNFVSSLRLLAMRNSSRLIARSRSAAEGKTSRQISCMPSVFIHAEGFCRRPGLSQRDKPHRASRTVVCVSRRIIQIILRNHHVHPLSTT